MPDVIPLETLQRWLQSVIIDPHGIEAGLASPLATTLIESSSDSVESIILPSRQLTSVDRLRIYGNAYFGRLLECLRSQFPAVHHAAGDEAFNGLAFGYLVSHPSRNDNLSSLGTSFESYLSATRPARSDEAAHDEFDFADFLIELARLEAVYNEVFDGPGPERVPSLDAVALTGLSAEQFSASVLQFHSCVRLLELHFPVHEYATAVRRGIVPSPPVARPVCLVVTRRDYLVRRIELTLPQFRMLSSLYQHKTVEESLHALCSNTDFDVTRLESDLQTWFRDWTAAPLFSGLIPAVRTSERLTPAVPASVDERASHKGGEA